MASSSNCWSRKPCISGTSVSAAASSDPIPRNVNVMAAVDVAPTQAYQNGTAAAFTEQHNGFAGGSTEDARAGDGTDGAYKGLSKKNRWVNHMPYKDLKAALKKNNLHEKGCREVLRRRLKTFYLHENLGTSKPQQVESRYRYLLVIDYEATCERENSGFKHEIIEFPVLIVDTELREIVAEFHSYVRPTINPQLSQFCVNLTGITQGQVDASDPFPLVLERVQQWLLDHELTEQNTATYAVVTDGPWDMARFLYTQCKLCQILFPAWGTEWINIRKSFSNHYKVRQSGIELMLESLGTTFEGQLHSGIDDSRNIARIAIQLIVDGCDLRCNERLFQSIDSADNEVEDNVAQDSLVQCIGSQSDYKHRQHHSRGQRHRHSNHRNHKPTKVTTPLDDLEPSDYDDLLRLYAIQNS